MNICVFDTETTSLDKPFCYNIGYVIADIEEGKILCQHDFVVEQIWHNLPLFSTAYYAEKRPLYVNRMRNRTCRMDKFGYICQQMVRDFRNYEVKTAYAFNSDFDERVFDFNCDWFKCINPFDDIKIVDIRALAVNCFGITEDYKNYCEKNNLLTENGNYSTTAESFFRYLLQDDFVEEHTALADSKCEFMILKTLYDSNYEIEESQKSPRYIERKVIKDWTIKINGIETYHIQATKMTTYKTKNTISFTE